MRNALQTVNPNDFETHSLAKKWFSEFDSDFNLEHAAKIRFNQRLIRDNLGGIQ